MDEPKETQDVKTSEDTKETSEKEPETFTKSQMDKAKSDVLAAAGRTAKSLEKREDAIKKGEERATQREKADYEAEIKAAGDDLDKLSDAEKNRKERERKAELLKREAELEEREEKVKGVEDVARKAEIREEALKLAAKHDVDIESLVNFTDGSTEKMEALAKLLPKKGEAQPLKVDSGKTVGGGKLTKERIEAMTSEEYAGNREEINKAFPLGMEDK